MNLTEARLFVCGVKASRHKHFNMIHIFPKFTQFYLEPIDIFL